MSRPILFLIAVLWGTAAVAQQSAETATGLARFKGADLRDRFLGGTVLELELSQGVPWRVFTLDNPRRMVLDFREVDWADADPAVIDRSDRVSSLRMGGFRPGWSRMVLDLARPMELAEAGLALSPDTGGATLRLKLEKTDPETYARHAGAPRDASWDLPPATAVRPAPPEDERPTVVLDPGHGGVDPGAQREGVDEADLMLTFAFELSEVLKRSGGYRVVLTRTDDVFVSLEARVAVAHQAGANIFISLHADAIEQGVAHGATVYTLSDEASDAASAALAERHDRDDILSGIDLSGADDRVVDVLTDLARLDNAPRSEALARKLVAGIEETVGVVHKRPLRQAGFSVLKAADIPSVLVEVGFLSTHRDLELLQDPAWRARMASGLRDGIEAWAVEDSATARLRRQ